MTVVSEPKIVYAWVGNPYKDPKARFYMGVPKFPGGQGWIRLEPGDDAFPCRFCDQTITKYPHYHSPTEVFKDHK